MNLRPSLKRQFFLEHRPSPELLAQAPQGPWNEQGFPVYQWEGIWYVAATEDFPSQDLSYDGSPFVLLNADPDDLRMIWEQLQKHRQPSIGSASSAESPQWTPNTADTSRNSQFVGIADEEAQSIESDRPHSPQDENEEVTARFEVAPSSSPKPTSPPTPLKPTGQTMTTRIDDVHIELVRSQLARLAEVYQQAMFLTYEDGFFVPRLWSQGFTSENKNGRYSGKESSPFKLIVKTLKSYHGYFEPSAPTEAFFTDWNPDQSSGHPKYPANLTLSPVSINQELIGAILCTGPKTTYNRNHLALVEKSARMIADLLLQEHTAA